MEKYQYIFKMLVNGEIVKHVFTLEEIERGILGSIIVSFIEVIARRRFTGLQAENGEDMYEGDIVSNEGMMDYIIFDKGCYVGGLVKTRDHFGNKQPISVHNNLTIEGNIYENPELLK